MPIRHKTHELEDASRRAFDSLLPLKWVSRPKSSDYGVDLEIEIFAESGEATGLLFYVQLKSSDLEFANPKIRLKTDSIKYLQSLELPTLIVHYSRIKNEFYGIWSFQIDIGPSQSQHKTMTINLDQQSIISSSSMNRLKSTVFARREAKHYSQFKPVPVTCDPSLLITRDRYIFDCVLDRIVSEINCLSICSEENEVCIKIIAEPQKLFIKYDEIS